MKKKGLASSQSSPSLGRASKVVLSNNATLESKQQSDAEKLRLAAQSGNLEIINQFVNSGMMLDMYSPLSKKSKQAKGLAIHEAVSNGHIEVTRALIAGGASVNLASPCLAGCTPLHIAAEAGHLALVTLLLRCNAYPLALDQRRWTPLDAGRAAHLGHNPLDQEHGDDDGINYPHVFRELERAMRDPSYHRSQFLNSNSNSNDSAAAATTVDAGALGGTGTTAEALMLVIREEVPVGPDSEFLLNAVTQLADKFGSLDIPGLVEKANTKLKNVGWALEIMNNVLGPIGQAQSAVSAVLSLVGSVLEMIAQAHANDKKAALLRRRLEDLSECLKQLSDDLMAKAHAMVQRTQQDLLNGKADSDLRDITALKGPLESVMKAVSETREVTEEWIARGAKLFGMIRKMLTASSTADDFERCSQILRDALQTLQTALQVRIFAKIDMIQKMQLAQWEAQSSAATAADVKALPGKIPSLLKSDPEFKAYFDENFDQVKDFLGEIHEELKSLREEMKSSINNLTETIKSAMGTSDKGPRVTELESRASDSFPGNRNLDVTDSEGQRVTLCFVGEDNEAFLHHHLKVLAIGKPLNVFFFCANLKIEFLVKKISFLYWNDDKMVKHFYFGDVTDADKERVIAAGKKDVEAQIFESHGESAAVKLGLDPLCQSSSDALEYVLDHASTNHDCVIVKIDTRESDSFPGNSNLDVTDSNGQRITLCFVGEQNMNFLMNHFKRLACGTSVDVAAVVANLRVALQVRDVDYVFWNATNGAHFYFGNDIEPEDFDRLKKLGKVGVCGAADGVEFKAEEDEV